MCQAPGHLGASQQVFPLPEQSAAASLGNWLPAVLHVTPGHACGMKERKPDIYGAHGVRGSHSGRFLQSPKVIIWSSSHFPSHPTKYSLVQIKREHMHTCTHIPLLLRGRVRTTARIPVPEVAGLGSFCAITPSLTHISTPLERICLLGLP